MIQSASQPAPQSASATLPLGVAAQAGQAEDAANAGDFALLLASTLTGEGTSVASPGGQADPILPADAVAGRQTGGKVAGKILPGQLPVPLPVAGLLVPQAAETPADDEAAPSTETPETAETSETPIPLLAATIVLAPVTLPAITPIDTGATEDSAKSAAAAPVTAPLKTIPADKPAPEQAPVEIATAQPKPESAAALVAKLTVALPETQRLVQSATSGETALPDDAAPQPASQTVAQPSLAAAASTIRVAAAPARTAASRAARASATQTAVQSTETAGQTASASVSTADALRQRPAQAGNVAPAQTPAAPSAPAIAARAAMASADAPAADGAAPVASELQPLIALRDAAATQSTPGTGPAAPAALAERGHDFAALVDRLVEARDAAMPQTVRAAINHAEFGQVSLRFDQGDSGLTVAMTSADPDFARAVQSAAPTGQTATTADNGSSSQRHDGHSQQSAGTASGQAQSQSSTRDGQSAQARDDAARTAATGRRATADEGEQPGTARDGIYA